MTRLTNAKAALWAAGWLIVAGVPGCGVDTVRVDVELGACDEQTAFVALRSVKVVLKRDDNASWVGDCVAPPSPPRSIDQLAALLSRSYAFRDVPVGGRWTLAVKGFSDESCGPSAVVVCGRTANVALPPPAGGLKVSINCLPAFTDLEEYKACVRE